MRALRIGLIVLAAYVGLALTFDGLVGLFQPGTDVLRTFDAEGEPQDRVLAVFEDGDTLYVQSGHHFRGWYHRVRENPDVELERDGVSKPYRAVLVESAEEKAHVVGIIKKRTGEVGYYVIRAILLFAEVRPVRLDPRTLASGATLSR
jgi:hypothetical protein